MFLFWGHTAVLRYLFWLCVQGCQKSNQAHHVQGEPSSCTLALGLYPHNERRSLVTALYLKCNPMLPPRAGDVPLKQRESPLVLVLPTLHLSPERTPPLHLAHSSPPMSLDHGALHQAEQRH